MVVQLKFFIDTANIEEIKSARELGILDGVTTNPSLVARETGDFDSVAKAILDEVEGPVSLEVVAEDAPGMITEAKALAAKAPNVVVKIPMTQEGIKATKTLSEAGIKTNVTLIFSSNQALLAAKAGATYVSPFLGRLDDQGWDGLQLISDIIDMYANYGFDTEVIAASIRHPVHVSECARMGCHVATIPASVIEKMFNHTLTDIGLKKFLEDWEKVKVR